MTEGAEGPEETAETETAAPLAITVPAWLADAPREGALAGIVRIELPKDALPWADAIDEQVLRRRAQYTAGVEFIAGNFGALEPLAWDGDALMLVFGGVAAPELPSHTFKAARDLWNRVRTELDLPVRLAAHVGRVRAGAEPGTVVGDDVEACRKLAREALDGTIALSEELSLALPEAFQQEIAVLGNRPGEERSLYLFPRSAVARTVADMIADEPARLWGKFRSYANGPGVRRIAYVGFRLQKKVPPRLDILDVFVPSEVELRRRADVDPRKEQALEDKLMLLPWSAQAATVTEEGARSFREVYAKHRSVVLLGDPGSGKTTLLRWLAVIAAAGSFSVKAALGVAERLLPLPISVGRLAEVRRGLGGETVSVVDALAGYFRGRSVHEDEAELRQFLAHELDRGRCLVLLDGLDEVKGEERLAIYQWLESFATEYSQNRFVVSSRVVGYTGFHLPGEVAEAVLRPFTEAQVERYVRAFHQAYVRWETNAEPIDEGEADRLLEALRASPRLSGLARNPFMLSALALIHRAEGKLPRHRVQVYEVFARALCETWAEARRLVAGETRKPTIEYEEEALPILGELALAMHEQYPTGVAPEEFVIGKLATALEHQKGVSGVAAQSAAREFLERAGQEVQLLLERGPGEWGFLHLTFQEFFVAAGLHAAERFQDVAFQHLFDPRWEEVIRLGVGYMALVQKRPTAAQRFVKNVLEYQAPEPLRWLTRLVRKPVPLAALLAAEAGDALPAALQERIAAALAEWLKEMPREISGPILKDLALTDFVPRVVRACLPQLADARPEVRARAAWSLGQLRSVEAADHLVAMLSDESQEVRLTAVAALKAVPLAAPMEKLASKLTDPRSEVRASAIEALTSVGAKVPVEVLENALKDPDEAVRVAAVRSCMVNKREESLEAMDIAAKDESCKVREAVAGIIAHFGDERRLKGLMGDKYDAVRTRAGFGLMTLNLPPSALAESDDETLRNFARIRNLTGAPIEAQIDALRSSDPITSSAAVIVLMLSNPPHEPFFALADDVSPEVRCSALALLAYSEQGIRVCLNALQDTEPKVRLLAAQMLACRKRREALAPLLVAFRERVDMRSMIAFALGLLEAEEAVEPLLACAEGADAKNDYAVYTAIGKIASSKHVERVESLLRRHQGPCAATDMIFSALWAIADREIRRAPEPSG